MSFQQRLIVALVTILAVELAGYWLSAFLKVDVSNGPDPSGVVLAIVGLIGTVWGTGELIAQKRSAEKKKREDEDADVSD